MRRTTPIVLVSALVALVVLFSAGPASAHEGRTVGKYSMAVGFGDEPAYAWLKNSVQMFLNEQATGKPVVDLGPTLKVEVIYGNQTFPAMTMEPNFEIGEFGATFSSVQDLQKSEFPVKDPTTGQLNDRLDREVTRIEGELADQRSSLQDKIDSAKLLGLIGIIVGGVGLVVGATALALRRRS